MYSNDDLKALVEETFAFAENEWWNILNSEPLFFYILKENPEPFFKLAKELYPGNYQVSLNYCLASFGLILMFQLFGPTLIKPRPEKGWRKSHCIVFSSLCSSQIIT